MWEIIIEAYLIVKQVSFSDRVGECSLFLWQATQGQRAVSRDGLVTSSLEEVGQFVEKCAAWLRGAEAAISLSFQEPETTLPDGVEGLFFGEEDE